MRIARSLRALALASISTCVLAGAPDFVEDFNSFTGVSAQNPRSPADTGGFWQTFPTGTPTSAAGFVALTQGFHGTCVGFTGDETRAMLQDQDIATAGPTDHQIAFTCRFTTPTGTQGAVDFVEVFSAVPADVSLVGRSIANYIIGVGKDPSGQTGIIVLLPTDGVGGYHPRLIPAEPNAWHKIIIQYKPSTSTAALDGSIRVWVDPTADNAAPAVDLPDTSGQVRSVWGIGRLSRFAIGNSTDLQLTLGAGTGKSDKVGSPDTKIDTVGGWYGTASARAGSLADARAFLAALDTSTVPDWTMY